MADKKISQLTGATTPLAGTEVLPIVQSSSTVKVSIANVTAGRAVSADSLTTTNDVTTGRNIVVTGAGTIEQNGAAGGLYFANTAVSGGATNQRFYTTNASGAAQLQFLMAGGATPTNDLYGNLSLVTGNLIQGTAAKGINFTANTPAAGMTSQLLNWYEEGTWTPNQGAGLTVVGAFSSSGTYTRIGRQITVRGQVAGATSVAVNAAAIITSNLPYSAATTHAGSMFNAAVDASGVVQVTSSSVVAATIMAATASITFTATYQV